MTHLDRDQTPTDSPASEPEAATPAAGRMPALYLGHGAPTLVDDDLWPVQLSTWAAKLPRPKSILVVSAHWEQAPIIVGATEPVPLVYDFYGFPERSTLTKFGDGASPSAATSSQRPSSVHSIDAS